jgi:hypothetical protein
MKTILQYKKYVAARFVPAHVWLYVSVSNLFVVVPVGCINQQSFLLQSQPNLHTGVELIVTD